ncbi:phosphoglycolate phosphatase [Maribius pontilimi]|uniref:phosphoglycolate phosphatase n=1 Tax=Palleronia pontilimi TaxID=1964209 RepID=A0A934ILL3_9RHOB|nr:phosphoglycolate phosphatase [Palleronia pontilimi]MBJ3764279.1 phosphoglycolate phosphatase [Palleronia pontilimi]
MARIVFDLDGTLIDSAPDIHAIANATLAGIGAAPITLAEARSFIGNGVPTFVARMRAARGIPDSKQEALTQVFLDRYDGAHGLTRIYPGAERALDRLRGDGHALGICTNKPERPCRAVLDHLDLARHFDVILGGDTLDRRKPDPAPLRAAFDALPHGPCLYVGDSDVDAETALRADVPFVLFTEGYRKSAIAELPHAVAFDDWSAMPGHVADLLAQGASTG